MSIKFGLYIDFELRKSVTTLNTKPGTYDCATAVAIFKLHYSAADGPILAKFSNLIQNSTQITAIWSKSQREEEFQYGRRLFFQKGSLIRGLRYVYEILFANR